MLGLCRRVQPEEVMFANAGPVQSVRSTGHVQQRAIASARRIAIGGASSLPKIMAIVMHPARAATNLVPNGSWLGHESVSSRGFWNQLMLSLLFTGCVLSS